MATMNGRDNPFGATKLERKNTLRRIKIQKIVKVVSAFLSFSIILFCFICVLVLLWA